MFPPSPWCHARASQSPWTSGYPKCEDWSGGGGCSSCKSLPLGLQGNSRWMCLVLFVFWRPQGFLLPSVQHWFKGPVTSQGRKLTAHLPGAGGGGADGVRAVALGHRNPAFICPCHGGPVNLLGPHHFATKVTAPLVQSRMAMGSSDRPGWGVPGSRRRHLTPWPAMTLAVPGTWPVPVRLLTMLCFSPTYLPCPRVRMLLGPGSSPRTWHSRPLWKSRSSSWKSPVWNVSTWLSRS